MKVSVSKKGLHLLEKALKASHQALSYGIVTNEMLYPGRCFRE
jgi:hypothetical protein